MKSKLKKMFKNTKEMNVTEIIKELNELEEYYVDCFKDESDVKTLSHIWSRIKELRKRLEVDSWLN